MEGAISYPRTKGKGNQGTGSSYYQKHWLHFFYFPGNDEPVIMKGDSHQLQNALNPKKSQRLTMKMRKVLLAQGRNFNGAWLSPSITHKADFIKLLKQYKGNYGKAAVDYYKLHSKEHPQVIDNTTPHDVIVRNPAKRYSVYQRYNLKVGPYADIKVTNGYQREHPIPVACYLSEAAKGRNRSSIPTIPDVGFLHEGRAIAYVVFDGQTIGTEHRVLTDIERNFTMMLIKQNRLATHGEWVDVMIEKIAEILVRDDIIREPDGSTYARCSTSANAKLVARCIMAEHIQSALLDGAHLDAYLTNGMVDHKRSIGINTFSEEMEEDL